MSMILDVMVLATILLCTIIYTRRGFIKGLMGLCGTLIAIIAAASTKSMLIPTFSAPIEKLLNGSAGSILSQLFDTSSTAESIAGVIAFILLFVVYLIALRLLTALIDHFCKLPVLKKANRFMGLLLGLCVGLLYAQILSIFLFTFSELLLAVQNVITAEAFEGSVIARWMFRYNIFRVLIGLL